MYAKRSGIQQLLQRNLLIFEAKLPNPLPHQGLEGCRRIVDFWADLSKEDAIDKRARDLERFYFRGQGNIALSCTSVTMEIPTRKDRYGRINSYWHQILPGASVNSSSSDLQWRRLYDAVHSSHRQSESVRGAAQR